MQMRSNDINTTKYQRNLDITLTFGQIAKPIELRTEDNSKKILQLTEEMKLLLKTINHALKANDEDALLLFFARKKNKFRIDLR